LSGPVQDNFQGTGLRVTRPRLPTFALVLALAASLGACQQGEAPAAPETAKQSAGPDAKPGMALAGGELVLPIVPGRPGAVYFTLRNGSDKPVSLVSAYVEGATSAEIHGMVNGTMTTQAALAIKPGETLTFAPGGLHVMAFELDESVAAGGTAEMTLSFADGDKLSAPVAVKAGGAKADGAKADAHGMDH
jgi:periplasmic copper chaperone A